MSGVMHAFVYNGTSYTTLNIPGASSTYAARISGSNIVGAYNDASGTHGFVYNGTSYTTLDVPGALGTAAYSISGSNIVGYYWDASSYHGFVYNGTSYVTLNVPGASSTQAFGISGSNIMGYYTDTSSHDHGFLATPSAVPVPALGTWRALFLAQLDTVDSRGGPGTV